MVNGKWWCYDGRLEREPKVYNFSLSITPCNHTMESMKVIYGIVSFKPVKYTSIETMGIGQQDAIFVSYSCF